MSAQATHAHWRALGTSVELVVTDPRALNNARALVERELEAIDHACSRFRDDSEITRANAGRGRVLTVGPLLIEALQVALRAAELTDGDVDPTLGMALELAGYDRDWELLEHPEMSALRVRPHRPCVGATVRAGWRAIELDPAQTTIRLPVGVKLDLGATAKAWAADRASRAVHNATGCGVLVSLGGDISTAGPSPARGWQIHVTDDHRSEPTGPGQTISISGGGIATSSTTVRRWSKAGGTMHHILDPSSGTCVEEVWRTASVAAIDCTDANIAATAAIVRGARAPEWLAEIGLPARLVGRDGDVLTVGSWPRGEELR
jgi:thiamine biosynthesis lipoprotein